MNNILALWMILSTCRTGEARCATWSEIDLENLVWVIPAHRTKSGSSKTFPITDRMVELLLAVKLRQVSHQAAANGYIFTNARGRPLSETSVLATMRRVGRDQHCSVHGFRTAFKHWALEEAKFPPELVYQPTPVERAYSRKSDLQCRRHMMEAWAAYLMGAAND